MVTARSKATGPWTPQFGRRAAAIAVPRIFWQAILVGPGRQKTGPFDFGMKASSLRTGRQHGVQAVVSLGPVPPQGQLSAWSPEAVRDSVAEGAGHIGCSDREAKTELDEDAEQGRSNVKAERLTRRSMEKRPGTRLPLELQVGTEGFTASAEDKELLRSSACDNDSCRVEGGDRDMVGGQHELVVEGSGSVEEWPSIGVARAQATAARQRSTEGGDVGSGGVSGNVPQAKPAGGRGEGDLQPGFSRQRPRAKNVPSRHGQLHQNQLRPRQEAAGA